jgi:hypothetical protein
MVFSDYVRALQTFWKRTEGNAFGQQGKTSGEEDRSNRIERISATWLTLKKGSNPLKRAHVTVFSRLSGGLTPFSTANSEGGS